MLIPEGGSARQGAFCVLGTVEEACTFTTGYSGLVKWLRINTGGAETVGFK